MRSMKKTLHSLKDTRLFGKKLLGTFPSKGTCAEVLALSGELGSGKTAFTKLLAKELDITERVISPTFILRRDYKIPKHFRFTHLVHIDAYRLENEKDLKPLKLEKKLKDSRTLVVVEWAERVRKAIPKNALWLTFECIDENVRRVRVDSRHQI